MPITLFLREMATKCRSLPTFTCDVIPYVPVQLYPSPWKPSLQTHAGGSASSWQNAFGPQDGEQPGRTAVVKDIK